MIDLFVRPGLAEYEGVGKTTESSSRIGVQTHTAPIATGRSAIDIGGGVIFTMRMRDSPVDRGRGLDGDKESLVGPGDPDSHDAYPLDLWAVRWGAVTQQIFEKIASTTVPGATGVQALGGKLCTPADAPSMPT